MQDAANFYAGQAALNNQQNIQRNQALSDDFRKQKIADTMAASNNLHKSIALLLDPDTMQPLPGKEDQVAQLRNQLGQLDGYVKNLYNPQFNPQTGAIQESALHKLGDKLHLTHPPAQPYTDYTGAPAQPPVTPGTVTTPVNKTAGQQLKDLQNIVSQNKDVSPLTDEAAKRQQMQANIDNVRGLLKKYNASDQTIQDVTEGMLGGVKPSAEKPPKYFSQLATTTDKSGKTHAYRVPMEEGAKAEEVSFPEDQTFTPKQSGAAPKVGSLGDFLTEAYGPRPTPEQLIEGRKKWAAAVAGTTVASHFVPVPQLDGSIKMIEVVTTSGKNFGTGTKGSGGGGGGGRVNPNGVIVGGKATPAQNEADKNYTEAVKLSSLADQVSQHPNDAVNQKRLAVALEKASAGRFTTQALDYIIQAGLGNTIEGWANKASTGALPSDVLRQLIDGAHQNLIAAKRARDDAFSTTPTPGGSGNSGGSSTPQRPKGATHTGIGSVDHKKHWLDAQGHDLGVAE